MAPFSPELLFNVMAAGVVFAGVMAVYIVAGLSEYKRSSGIYSHVYALSDALFWITGVFSMQGR